MLQPCDFTNSTGITDASARKDLRDYLFCFPHYVHESAAANSAVRLFKMQIPGHEPRLPELEPQGGPGSCICKQVPPLPLLLHPAAVLTVEKFLFSAASSVCRGRNNPELSDLPKVTQLVGSIEALRPDLTPIVFVVLCVGFFHTNSFYSTFQRALEF